MGMLIEKAGGHQRFSMPAFHFISQKNSIYKAFAISRALS
jgi:hypothetical protein